MTNKVKKFESNLSTKLNINFYILNVNQKASMAAFVFIIEMWLLAKSNVLFQAALAVCTSASIFVKKIDNVLLMLFKLQSLVVNGKIILSTFTGCLKTHGHRTSTDSYDQNLCINWTQFIDIPHWLFCPQSRAPKVFFFFKNS